MRTHYTAFHVLSATAGLGILAVDVGTNVDHMYHQTGTLWDSSIAAVIAVGLGTALSLTACHVAIRAWKPVTAGFLLVAFILGAAYSLTATLDRVATLRDQSLERIWLADSELVLLRHERDRARRDANDECSVKRGGRGEKCGKAEEQLKAVTARVTEREDALNPLGKRLATLIPGITVRDASLFQPLLLPAALFMLGNWLLAFGMAGQKPKAEFGTSLSRRDELEARAQRFAMSFEAAHGRKPKVIEFRDNLNVSAAVAKRLHDRVTSQ